MKIFELLVIIKKIRLIELNFKEMTKNKYIKFMQENSISLGKKISKSGFDAEKVFKEFIESSDGLIWFQKHTGIEASEIKSTVLSNGSKIDVLAEVRTGEILTRIGFSLKKTESDFNQLERRSVKRYASVFNFSEECVRLLNLFVGHEKPNSYTSKKTKSSKRMFLDEFTENDQEIIINNFKDNIKNIIEQALQGSGEEKPQFLVLSKDGKDFSNSLCLSMKEVINKLVNGDVKVSPRGSLILGKTTIQRKGGDGGAESAKDLQHPQKKAPCFSYGDEF